MRRKITHVDFDINSLIADFLILRQTKGLSKHALSKDAFALKLFVKDYLGTITDTTSVTIAIGKILCGKSNAYHNKLLQTYRQFFQYCIDEGLIELNPSRIFKFKKETPRIVQHSEETIKAVLDLPDKTTFSGFRDYTFMLVMLDSGIRPNELLQLKPADIDFNNSQIVIREDYSKTKQLRLLPISPQVLSCLRKLISVRHPEWGLEIPVFCTYTGKPYSSHNFQERFRQYSQQLGTSITAYHLRHIFALWFIRNGGNPFALKTMLGHTTMEMTLTYVALEQMDIKNAHKLASPINTIFSTNTFVKKLK